MSSAVAEAPAEIGRPAPRTPRKRWSRFILPVFSTLVFLYVIFPILIVILYGFNQSHTRLPQVVFKWQGFTLNWYREAFSIPGLTPAFFLSLRLGLASMAVSTILGTSLALALVRFRFRGKAALEQIMFLNIAVPEIVLGAALLGFYITIQGATQFRIVGLPGLLVAHVTFSIAYVAITVRARLAGFDRAIEEAAHDLGATPWVTFWKVTLPLIRPAVLAGALMSFVLSIDDYVVSSFVAGSRVTFPLWVFGASRVGIPPQVFVLGTMIFVVGLIFALVGLVLQRRGRG